MLNFGLNFCKYRPKFNKTEVVSSFLRWTRSMAWTEFWQRKREKEAEEEVSEDKDEESEDSF